MAERVASAQPPQADETHARSQSQSESQPQPKPQPQPQSLPQSLPQPQPLTEAPSRPRLRRADAPLGSAANLPDLSGYLDGSSEPPAGLPATAAAARSTVGVGFLVLLVFSLSVALWSSRTPDLTCPDCNCGSDLAAAPPKSESGAEALLGLGLSVFATTLVLCVISSYLMLQYDWSFLPDCIAYVLLGALVGSLLRVFGSGSALGITLPNQEQFFIFILPPIMFEAGYSLSKSDFFAEAASICMFAVPGTIISALVFGICIYFVGIIGASSSFSFWEAMTFGSLLSAVDPVATIAVFSALNVNKTLHFLVFGESVLNDAVAIVLYRTFSKLIGAETYHSYSIVLDFVRIFFGSSILGALSGVIAALVLKYTKLYRSPALEMSFFLLMAYLPYFVCEGLELSGIMGILANGVVLAHYAHHNLSKVTQISAQQSFRTLAFLAETFVFVFLGSALTTFDHSWHGLTVMWAIVLTLVSRAANIYPLTRLVNKWRDHKISPKNQLIMWFSGLRGAVAFALSLNFPSVNGSDETRRMVISTTLAVVLFTVIVLGGGIMPLLRLLRVESGEANNGGAFAADSLTNETDNTSGRGAAATSFSPRMRPRSLEEAVHGSGRDPGASDASRKVELIRAGHLPHQAPPAFENRNGQHLLGKLQRLDDEYVKPWLLAGRTRSMAATNRTLQTLAVVESQGLTPHELGRVLDSTAATVVPDVGLDEEQETTAVGVSNMSAHPSDLRVTRSRSRSTISPDIIVDLEVAHDVTDGSSEADNLLPADMRLDDPVDTTCITSDR